VVLHPNRKKISQIHSLRRGFTKWHHHELGMLQTGVHCYQSTSLTHSFSLTNSSVDQLVKRKIDFALSSLLFVLEWSLNTGVVLQSLHSECLWEKSTGSEQSNQKQKLFLKNMESIHANSLLRFILFSLSFSFSLSLSFSFLISFFSYQFNFLIR
jgi:hypothetical protein